MANYAQHVSTRVTPQSEQVPGKAQVENSAGGYVFPVDCWTKLHRFLTLGNEGGSYYATERVLTQENAGAVLECYSRDPDRTICTIAEMSLSGRAPKNDPAIFCLAMLSKDKRALDVMPDVCRTGRHLFQFVKAARQFRGMGRAMHTAIRKWYTNKDPRYVAYQVTKYQQRDGWSHRDILRLAKPRADKPLSDIFKWVVGKMDADNLMAGPAGGPMGPILALEAARRATNPKQIVDLIEEHDLVHECIPTQWLKSPAVWEALLKKMPMTAMIRNLGRMSNIGLLKPMSKASQLVTSRLADQERIVKARIHPIAILLALCTYRSGCGFRGSLAWNPDGQVIDALDAAFYMAFAAVEPTGNRHMLALDVSSSMSAMINDTSLSCRDASAAMAMVTVKTEPLTYTTAFTGGGWGRWGDSKIEAVPFSKVQSLADAVRTVHGLEFGMTDCALPMLHAIEHGIEVDVFVIYTDNETWAGNIHPFQALQQYREKTGIPAKLITVGMTSNGFSIADPSDAGMMDVVGFDTNVPAVMNNFATQ